MRIVRSVGSSTITQTAVAARPATRRSTIVTEVDWHERQKLLKLAFPLDVHADRAASEIQFGHVHRPTHANTSWDAARFETCAHRWVHVGEPGYGVAVVNDATYGHDVTRTPDRRRHHDHGAAVAAARAAVPRPGRRPGPAPVRGGAAGRARRSATRSPRATGSTCRCAGSRGGATVAPLLAVDDPAVVVEAVKLAEDGSGDVVVRLYEALGRPGERGVHAGFAHASVVETDLLERPLPEPVALAGGRLRCARSRSSRCGSAGADGPPTAAMRQISPAAPGRASAMT